jgi:hypothetical protein
LEHHFIERTRKRVQPRRITVGAPFEKPGHAQLAIGWEPPLQIKKEDRIGMSRGISGCVFDPQSDIHGVDAFSQT